MIVLGLVGLWLAVAATAVAAQEGQILKRPQATRADPVIESSPVQHHSEIIERTRRMVRDYIDELPNFICTRTTRTSWELPRTARKVAPKTVVVEGRFVDGRESYSVVSVNGIPWDDPTDSRQVRIRGGLGDKLRRWFRPQAKTQFKRSRDVTVNGRQAYAFRVVNSRPVDRIGMGFNPDGSRRLEVHVGVRGWIYIEKTSGNVLRMVAEEMLGIPAKHPVRQFSFRIDYDYVPIGDSVHLMPVERLNMWHMRSGWVIQDVIDYTGHRKFDVESSLTFSDSTPSNK